MKLLSLTSLLTLALFSSVYAQDTTGNKVGKGLVNVKAEDGSFGVKLNARMQNLYEAEINMADKSTSSNFLIRRARLKMEGFAVTPKLTYKIELGQSTRDISLASDIEKNTASVILDAVVKYNFYGNWSVWFGQTKLPGNIERLISSGSLQFVDRSLLNSKFNIDRDQGIQLRYKGEKFRYSGAISIGEGRNDINDNLGGYDYTNRIELLPMGGFDGNEYKSSDHKRESSPKLMLGLTYDYNDNAAREKGNLGSYMWSNDASDEAMGVDLNTIFADAHFKYSGLSIMAEYANKWAKNDGVYDITDANGLIVSTDAYYTGTSYNFQTGYLFKNMWEIAGRYTSVNINDNADPYVKDNDNTMYTLGISKYIVGHTIKVQSDVSLVQQMSKDDIVMFRFQVELGI